jgi:hypothetical protein
VPVVDYIFQSSKERPFENLLLISIRTVFLRNYPVLNISNIILSACEHDHPRGIEPDLSRGKILLLIRPATISAPRRFIHSDIDASADKKLQKIMEYGKPYFPMHPVANCNFVLDNQSRESYFEISSLDLSTRRL